MVYGDLLAYGLDDLDGGAIDDADDGVLDEEQIQLLSMLMDVGEGGELDAGVNQGFEEKKDGSLKRE